MTVTNGCASSVPFLITRRRPPCSVTNRRPSGANAIAVGALRPLATCVSANPDGRAEAPAVDTIARNASAAKNANNPLDARRRIRRILAGDREAPGIPCRPRARNARRSRADPGTRQGLSRGVGAPPIMRTGAQERIHDRRGADPEGEPDAQRRRMRGEPRLTALEDRRGGDAARRVARPGPAEPQVGGSSRDARLAQQGGRLARAMADLPSGAVTFLFTDIEGSTRLVRAVAEPLRGGSRRASAADPPGLLAPRRPRARHARGRFLLRVRECPRSVLAAVEAQRALSGYPWPDEAEVKVRMGIHTGQAAPVNGRYTGLAVHRAARICSAGHGGQILVSQATQSLLEDEEEDLAVGMTRPRRAAAQGHRAPRPSVSGRRSRSGRRSFRRRAVRKRLPSARRSLRLSGAAPR